jgi:hypothetical protein
MADEEMAQEVVERRGFNGGLRHNKPGFYEKRGCVQEPEASVVRIIMRFPIDTTIF